MRRNSRSYAKLLLVVEKFSAKELAVVVTVCERARCGSSIVTPEPGPPRLGDPRRVRAGRAALSPGTPARGGGERGGTGIKTGGGLPPGPVRPRRASSECTARPAPRRVGFRAAQGPRRRRPGEMRPRVAKGGGAGRAEGRGRGEGRASGGRGGTAPRRRLGLAAASPVAGAKRPGTPGGGARGRRAGVAAADCTPPGAGSAWPRLPGWGAEDLSLSTWPLPAGALGGLWEERSQLAPGMRRVGWSGDSKGKNERLELRPGRTLDSRSMRGRWDARPELLPLPVRLRPKPGVISCPSCREQFEEPTSSLGQEGARRGSIAGSMEPWGQGWKREDI